MVATYQEMKDRVITLIDRDDAETIESTDNRIVNWVDVALRNAELRFYRSETARIPPFEKYVHYTVPKLETELTIPADYFEGRYAISKVGQMSTTMSKTSPEQILNDNLTSATVLMPKRIAYGSNVWLIDRVAQQTEITAYYYGYIDAISEVDDAWVEENGGHWLLNNADDLLQFYAGYELSMFYGSIDSQQADRWLQRGNEIAESIFLQEQRQKASLSSPKVGRPYRRL